jgi:hypothetical protein
MAHIKNNEFTIYTGLCETATDCFHAYQHLTAQGIPFRALNYGDPSQIPAVLQSLQSWFPDATLTFPLVTYSEVYEDTDPQPRVAKVVSGLADIQATNWTALASFGA